MTGKRGHQVLYRAPFVVPVCQPVIADGAVLVADGLITAVGAYADLRGQGDRVVELERRILTPALLNCHSHLELSCFAGLGRDESLPKGDITDWIRALLQRRQVVTTAEIQAAAIRAWQEMRAGGIALSLDIGNDPAFSLPGAPPGIEFTLEFLGLAPPPDGWGDRLVGLAMPCTAHAPHTTNFRMIQTLKERSLRRGDKFPIHVAESSSELEFLHSGSGPFHKLIAERLGRVDFFEPPGCGAVEYLDRLGVLDRSTLCVHCVHISEAEAGLLAERQAGVCLCPGSNRTLGVGRANPAMLLDKGIRPSLGTDSLASNAELNMWREMRILHEDHPALDPAAIFAMATSNGAAALGRNDLGSLQAGRAAQILAVEYDDLRLNEVYSYLVDGNKPGLDWLENVDA